jgi:hypothetical protein
MDMNEPIPVNTNTSETHAEVVWEVQTHRIVRRKRDDKWAQALFVLEASDGNDAMGEPRWRQLVELDGKSTFEVLIRAIAILSCDKKKLQGEVAELRLKING